jgi:hypothetical protein
MPNADVALPVCRNRIKNKCAQIPPVVENSVIETLNLIHVLHVDLALVHTVVFGGPYFNILQLLNLVHVQL